MNICILQPKAVHTTLVIPLGNSILGRSLAQSWDQLWADLGPVLDRSLFDFGPILDCLWADFGPTVGRLCGPILGQLWADLGPTLGRSWADFGPILGRLWVDYKPTLGRLLPSVFSNRSCNWACTVKLGPEIRAKQQTRTSHLGWGWAKAWRR